MNTGRPVFTQVSDVLIQQLDALRRRATLCPGASRDALPRPVPRDGFAQTTFRESLRDIVCLRYCPQRYAMGIRGNITRTNLAYANEFRDWRVYEALGQILIPQSL